MIVLLPVSYESSSFDCLDTGEMSDRYHVEGSPSYELLMFARGVKNMDITHAILKAQITGELGPGHMVVLNHDRNGTPKNRFVAVGVPPSADVDKFSEFMESLSILKDEGEVCILDSSKSLGLSRFFDALNSLGFINKMNGHQIIERWRAA